MTRGRFDELHADIFQISNGPLCSCFPMCCKSLTVLYDFGMMRKRVSRKIYQLMWKYKYLTLDIRHSGANYFIGIVFHIHHTYFHLKYYN